ncbi:histidine kinase [Rippkaea orientalis PCC 8801]|uniref:histidine kinase n=1 Tax=Rippkaea orientalis (strain PCC 8801 / RF-1) TaxID=41431 RepID=B7K2Y8_RIPO1|nr:HAMP domain-containing sensor histidine kinase [Rippkaea orientalis]ACK67689.1 histidine kinase [Rippkaea orientalis PCC 8801]
MAVSQGLLVKLSDIINRYEGMAVDTCLSQQTSALAENTTEQIHQARLKAQNEWFGAIAAIESLLLSQINEITPDSPTCHGLILSAPTPILCHPKLTSQLQTGVFTPQATHHLSLMRLQLPAAYSPKSVCIKGNLAELPLFPEDPIATEQFCLVFTPLFALIAVLGEDSLGLPAFQFSFEPEVIEQGWLTLRSRLCLTHYPQLSQLDALVRHFAPPTPDYRLVSQFSRLLLHHLPPIPTVDSDKPRLTILTAENTVKSHSNRKIAKEITDDTSEVPLLQALTHEIRTPLTTIRTMTRLLLRNKELTPQMVKLLETIDQECSEQINRMELIFRATEVNNSPQETKPRHLVSTSLEEVLQQSIPRWKKQAQRRNVMLDVVVPKKLPQVVSDPAMLDQVLTGLIEKFTRSFSDGGQIRIQVTTAGHQLKLQFQTESHCPHNPLKALGKLLMFHPNTGSLSLNLDVTKHLFHELGGKLIVRQRSEYGEVFTIFLPLGNRESGVME